MKFPFEIKTKNGQKATVLGTMRRGMLVGRIAGEDALVTWDRFGWCVSPDRRITIPLQIKPLTFYRMRNGIIVWTSEMIHNGLIRGMGVDGCVWSWRVADGRGNDDEETAYDLIEEIPSMKK